MLALAFIAPIASFLDTKCFANRAFIYPQQLSQTILKSSSTGCQVMSTMTTPKLPPVVMDAITEQIGNSPMVKLNRIPQSLGIEASVYAKLEFFNAGGSVKDRIALRMIEEAERSGRIKPGDTLIEPTSGNT